MKIRSTTKVLLAGLIVIGSFGASLFAGELRGFGKVNESKLETSGNVTGRRFVCENPEKARVLMHKVGRDLSQSATEKASWEKVTIGQHQANVLVRPGQGSYLPVCKGKDVLVYTSRVQSLHRPRLFERSTSLPLVGSRQMGSQTIQADSSVRKKGSGGDTTFPEIPDYAILEKTASEIVSSLLAAITFGNMSCQTESTW
ncbi:MAG: hypothetical protein O3A82_02550 [Verrucomicrobia bacterium]|nr:hypothetical protein [Verrucomicrobiota bacterium]MDA0722930.1 hypothetical protein [Verrucomicrobiota bacterium]MDA1045790.1 hypothetical protein [Verrucomicrobiota bacterium]